MSASMPAETALDRFSRKYFPGWHSRRQAARFEAHRIEVAAEMLETARQEFRRGGYEGASKSPGMAEWSPSNSSADEDLLPDLDNLRSRARDLDRNDPHADGLANAFADAIVGSGLVPQPLIDVEELGISEEEGRSFSRQAVRIFRERWWPHADYAGNLPFGELQRVAAYGCFMSGDGWGILRPREIKGRLSTRIQLIEADQVMTPPQETGKTNVREGVILDEFGHHAAVWVKKTHPGDFINRGAGGYSADDFIKVPTHDEAGRKVVLRMWRTRRPGQSRGAPALASALSFFRELKQYMKAELMAAKIAACFAVFISTEDPLGLAAANAQSRVRRDEQIRPGTVKYMGLGDRVEIAKPGRNAGDFAGFLDVALRAVGCGVRTPPEITGNDFSRTTYTSGRMALTMARAGWAIWQGLMASEFCQPVYERVILEAVLRGQLRARGFLDNPEAWTRARWKGPAQTWVDPQREVDATLNAVAGNLTTFADECAARGVHWEDLFEQRAKEEALRERLNLPAFAPAGQQQQQPEEPARNAGKKENKKPESEDGDA